MLQINQQHAAPIDRDPTPDRIANAAPVSPGALIESLLNIARRQLIPIAFITALTTTLSLVYIFVTPPTFKAEALMLIDRGKVQLFQQQQLFLDSPVDAAAIESQVQILKSENVARAVIKKLNLTESAEFGKLSETSGSGLSIFGFFHALQSSPPTNIDQRAVDAFQRSLDATRIGGSFLISVTFKSHSAERAAQIANATVDAYINYQMQQKFEATRRANTWLQDRIRELAEQTAIADRAVAEFKAKNNIVSTGAGRLMSEQQLSDLNVRLLDARSQTSAAQARLDRVESIIANGGDFDDSQVSAAVGDSLTNPIITQQRTKYLELKNREAELVARVGAGHLAVLALKRQIREVRNSIFDELQRIAETYKSDLVISKQRQETIEKALADTVSQSGKDNQAQSVLLDLEAAAKARHSLYSDFEQRFTQSTPSESFAVSDARLVNAASVPLARNSPKVFLVVAIGVFGGLILGCGIGLLREMLDRVFRTGGQIEQALGTTCIALVPAVKNDTVANASKGRTQVSATSGQSRNIIQGSDIFWSVCASPFSRFAEAIRSLKLAVDLNRLDRPHGVVGFTSALPNEGKTTIAASFALLVAQVGARVILVDADLRNPSLSRLLTPNATSGLLEVISGQSSLEDVIWRDPTTNMTFLPSFAPFRLAHSSEILASDRTAQFFEQLREKYDYVVVDLSPLAPVVDVRATRRLVDAYVLVVEWGRTRIPIVERALGEGFNVYENLIGVLLNKADIDSVRRYDWHFGDYYRNEYYSRYGYVD